MLAQLRSLVAALTVVALLTGFAAPAFADQQQSPFNQNFASSDNAQQASVPVVLDILLLRPLGLLMTAGGIVLYAFPVMPITAITRPSQILKPLGPLVATPARFTFSDPLGSHP
jgi:hypothetical protein